MKIHDIPRSGSYQGVTSSRNRYGQYVRTRAVPVNPASAAQGAARGRLSLNSATWRDLTDEQRAGWEALALLMQRSDSLGSSYTLNGFGAYCSVNNNQLAAGNAVLSDAPAMVSPGTLTTATITLTAAAHTVAYTVTPLAAGQKLLVYASPQRSAGRSYESDYRLVFVSAAAAASPADIEAAYNARFGVPVVGNRVNYSLHIYEGGFRSGPLLKTAVVSA